MSEGAFQEAVVLLGRARRTGTVLRLVVLLGAIAALVCLRLAAGRPLIVVDVAVILLAMCAVVMPDGQFGTLIVIIIGVAWLVTVHRATTPWTLGAALALLAIHTALAAASVAAPSAEWSPALRRRWLRRALVLAAACVASWLVVAAVHGRGLPASGALIAAALVLVAVAAMWCRDVALQSGSLRDRSDASPR